MPIKNIFCNFSIFDKFFYICLFAITATSIFLLGINLVFFKYIGVAYFINLYVFVLFCCLLLSLVSSFIRADYPKTYGVLHGYAQYICLILVNVLFIQAVQYSPFDTIDNLLRSADNFIGFNNVSALQYVYSVGIVKYLLFFYYSFTYEVFALPFAALFFISRVHFCKFLLSSLIVFIVIALAYYFFPAKNPSSVYNSNLFLPASYLTGIKFDDVHDFIKYPFAEASGGIFVCPSPHVAISLLLSYLWLEYKPVFIVIALYNLIVSMSAVLLGFHYLVDALLALFLVVCSIIIVEMLLDRSHSDACIEKVL